jgi:hypothetical protein
MACIASLHGLHPHHPACIAPHCTALHALHCTALHCIACIALQRCNDENPSVSPDIQTLSRSVLPGILVF